MAVSAVFSVYGLKTRILCKGDDLTAIILSAAEDSECHGVRDGDVIVIAESAVATAEGREIRLQDVVPSQRAEEVAQTYAMDPRLAEVVLRESDAVVGGIPGFLLTLKNGTLLPNAGVDCSNTPAECALPLPCNPDQSAERLRRDILQRKNTRTGVIIADSRTHAMRLGCCGVAIGCAGIPSVIDERGRTDLFGKELKVTRRAVADCIASAAELVMGEADESVPAALIRGVGLPVGDHCGIATIDASECLFMGVALHADPSIFDGKEKPGSS
jgi:coenzyme F420-0:L-glutamate ligase